MSARKSSLVDYSKVSSRPEIRQPSSSAQQPATTANQSTTATAPPVISAQMDAVMRLMTGREERTIAEKLADSNRPTWEQNKKDNHDKLNLDTLDQKQMDEYRRQLDEERDRRMAGLPAHESNEKHAKKKKRHKKKRKRSHNSDDSNSDESIGSSKSESDDDNKRRQRHKKHRKHHEKKSKHRSSRDSDPDKIDDNAAAADDDEKVDRGKRKQKKYDSKTDEWIQ